MIEKSARRSLSQDVRRLLTGRMTNDQFDDVFYHQYDRSRDRAVGEISSFCYSLYSSDLLLPYRLRGPYTVDAETRSAAGRCVLFLRSGLEYEWPPFPDCIGIRVLAGFATSLGIPAGIALLLIGMTMFAGGWDYIVGLFAILGALLLVSSSAFSLLWPALRRNDWQAFYGQGDYDVWPFLRRQDFEHARMYCHLLGRR